MWETFQQGLLITVVGMALVFLTLLVVMLVIRLLDRVFRPAPAKAAEERAPAPSAKPVLQAAVADMSDEIAAIAVAIALGQAGAVRRAPIALPPVVDIFDSYDRNAVGEVVNVVNIQPGSGSWRSYGRVKAMQ